MALRFFIEFLQSVLMFSWIFSGCGYTQKTVLPKNIQSIYVDTVKNKIPLETMYTYVPGLEMQISNAITRRLEVDGNLKLVGKREEADAVLETVLTGLEQGGTRFTSLESVEEYRMFMVVACRLLDPKSGEIIWEEGSFTGDAEYFVGTVRSIAREEGAKRAADQLARNIVDRIVEDW